jgi:hypothetical protein
MMDNVGSKVDSFEGLDGKQTAWKLLVLFPPYNEQEAIHLIRCAEDRLLCRR